ncbi:MAG: hypothetical protein EZS28_045669, partial [Streblomastix strix]
MEKNSEEADDKEDQSDKLAYLLKNKGSQVSRIINTHTGLSCIAVHQANLAEKIHCSCILIVMDALSDPTGTKATISNVVLQSALFLLAELFAWQIVSISIVQRLSGHPPMSPARKKVFARQKKNINQVHRKSKVPRRMTKTGKHFQFYYSCFNLKLRPFIRLMFFLLTFDNDDPCFVEKLDALKIYMIDKQMAFENLTQRFLAINNPFQKTETQQKMIMYKQPIARRRRSGSIW